MASRVVGGGEGEGDGTAVVREVVALAGEIAGKSQIAVQAQKEAVNAGTFGVSRFLLPGFPTDDSFLCLCVSLAGFVAYEQGLSEGLRTERRLFDMTFATADQKEGACGSLVPELLCSLLMLASRHGGLCGEAKAQLYQVVKRICAPLLFPGVCID